MIKIEQLAGQASENDTLTLNYDQRTRCRLRVTLDSGKEAGLFLPRGTVLKHNDMLQSSCGLHIRVIAAREPVSAAYPDSALLMARLCYHLGNRHVMLDISDNRLAWQQDHVLDDMVRQLGVEPKDENASFNPESGAYGHGHGHGHSHDH